MGHHHHKGVTKPDQLKTSRRGGGQVFGLYQNTEVKFTGLYHTKDLGVGFHSTVRVVIRMYQPKGPGGVTVLYHLKDWGGSLGKDLKRWGVTSFYHLQSCEGVVSLDCTTSKAKREAYLLPPEL